MIMMSQRHIIRHKDTAKKKKFHDLTLTISYKGREKNKKETGITAVKMTVQKTKTNMIKKVKRNQKERQLRY